MPWEEFKLYPQVQMENPLEVPNPVLPESTCVFDDSPGFCITWSSLISSYPHLLCLPNNLWRRVYVGAWERELTTNGMVRSPKQNLKTKSKVEFK
jgi:hypothetical protein